MGNNDKPLSISGGVPAGWVLVPVEPTEWMIGEGMRGHMGALYRGKVPINQGIEDGTKAAKAIWSAMLAATPTPPIEGRDADVERVEQVAGAMWNASPYYDGTPWDDVSWRRYNGTCDTRELYLALARAALQALGERP